MDSQEWVEQFPAVSVKIAKTILASHGWDDDSINCEDDRIVLSGFREEGYEYIASIDKNGEVDSQQLVNWLGY